MKFESNFGIGEVCIYNENAKRDDRQMDDLLVKILAITFGAQNEVVFTVESTSIKVGIQRITCGLDQLTGDPDFNQETGSYAPE